MNDITAISVFVGCFVLTLGLVRACEWLGPRGLGKKAAVRGGGATEDRS